MAKVTNAQRPARLQIGDEIRVIAPSWSLAMIHKDVQRIATDRFEAKGLRLTFGAHVNELDQFLSSSIESRVDDLHAAFADPDVRGVFAVIGGYNANQLLPYLDWDLIAANPKVFCGYSDTTALSCAMYERSGLISYSGPAYSTFGMRDHFEQIEDWCWRVLFDGGTIVAEPSPTWSDDEWFVDQDARVLRSTDGPWAMNHGAAHGPLVGGNLCTLNLLQGTPYMPTLAGHVVFLEDDQGTSVGTFDRDLTSLSQMPGFDQIAGLLIGRFQESTKMTRRTLAAILASKPGLKDVPVVANMDFGHTYPMLTVPVGETATVEVSDGGTSFSFEA